MKNYLFVSTALFFAACNSQNATDVAKQDVRDSVNAAIHANEVRQRTIDSMEAINSAAAVAASNAATPTENAAASQPAEAKKKGMSNKTKGALIGTGAGIVGGAVTGAAVSKDKGKGAVVGGIIGGAVGSGVGYGAGAKKDEKGK